jgi:hypothetical protein
MRNIGSSAGASFVATRLAWRAQFHHSRLAGSITPYTSLHGMTVLQCKPLVQTQAVLMSYLDIFRIFAVIALLLCPVIPFLKSPIIMGTQGASVGH